MNHPVRLGGWVLLACLSLPVRAGDLLTLAEAQRLAVNAAPQLQMLRAQENSAQEASVAAAQLPNPVLKYGITNVPVSGDSAWSLGRESMTMRSVSLMQQFAREDKRQAGVLRALSQAGTARANAREAIASIRRDTAFAWFDVAHQQRIGELLSRQEAILGQQIQIAERAWQANRSSQEEVFAIRLKKARNHDLQTQNHREQEMARARLERWIGADAQRPPASLPPTATSSLSLENLDAQAHPLLREAQEQVDLARADARLARARRTPDVSVELMYSQRGPNYADMVSLNVSMPLPWDRPQREDREVASKYALLEAARARQDDTLRIYRNAVRESLVAWQADRVRLADYDSSLVPTADQQVSAATSDYRAGRGNLLRVLGAQVNALQMRLEREQVALQADKVWAQLRYLNPHADAPETEQGVQP